MELRDAVLGRRMTRAYDPHRPIAREQLKMLLNLAIRAPSAGHTQGWEFLVLDDITSRSAFWSATADGPPDRWRAGMQTAPVLVVCLSDRTAYELRYAEADKRAAPGTEAARRHSGRTVSSWLVPYWHIDTGMAALLLMLGAQDAGLGSCLFAVPADRWPTLAARFAIPDRLLPVAVVSLGYPAPDLRSGSLARGRRAVDEVTHWGGFPPLVP